MATTDYDSLASRIGRVERQLRWWKTLSAGIVIILCVLAGMMIVNFRSNVLNSSKSPGIPDEIVARKFILVARDGKTAATLESRKRGALLALNSPHGIKLQLNTDDPGLPGPGEWRVVDSKGRTLPDPGGAMLMLNATPGGTSPAYIMADAVPDGTFSLSLNGAQSAIDIRGSSEGDTGIDISGKNEFWTRASLSTDPKGQASLRLFGKQKGGDIFPRAELSLDDNDRPSLSLYDSDLKTRAVLGSARLEGTQTGSTEETGPSSLVLFDKTGHVIWRTP